MVQMSDLCDMFVHERLGMSVIRRQLEIHVEVPTIPVSTYQSDKVVWFAGAQFEPPHSPVALCTRKLFSQVFVTGVSIGGPADMYCLQLNRFVTEVQGVPTTNFEDFVEEIKRLPDKKFFQMGLIDLHGSLQTVSMMLNLQDFPTCVARQKVGSSGDWHLQEL